MTVGNDVIRGALNGYADAVAAGMEDDPWQVIPTAWVDAAMARWKPLEPRPEMDSVGVDVAMGGKDQTVIARRHGNWFDVPIAHSSGDLFTAATTTTVTFSGIEVRQRGASAGDSATIDHNSTNPGNAVAAPLQLLGSRVLVQTSGGSVSAIDAE